ncbi:ABC transporter permease [Testudinibacter sp. TR-2022]|uniref:ABC transporter permease n=1 Tax=Testudinibacter sp. TR-2022 TaxID=2585029 RepID=UPI001118FB33|nr:ABC transporter permease [Testudinibacter sp. TR-2022]TNH04678.1 ABC transporter permease [Pasteurellaceae bacterium Phil31]TNH10132.1 ABC transporter permease [Testudinibacter sp. TR-2022]TNH12519.1 ABC transporter permease [Testudinibacter sp. TR-2022]TNH15542.1 ABC transporter permease [Testudinibacter sp. TR-2022]TNH17086.1 ABC transporter permease [Testudinibacter sp. TR-2022]
MLLRMLLQSWKHGLRRKFLAIFTIFLAAGLVSALLAVSIDIGDKMAKELKSYGANILIEPAAQAALPQVDQERENLLLGQDFLDEKELPNIKDIFWGNNIVGFAPQLNAPFELISHNGQTAQQDISVLGTFFDYPIGIPDDPDYHTGQKIISPYWQVEGKWADDSDKSAVNTPTQALVGRQLAANANIHIGDRLQLIPFTDKPTALLNVVVSGILSSGGNEENQLIVPLQAVQNSLNLHGKVQSVRVSALTVPENDLSRKARENLEALDAEEYDRWYCTAYVSSIAHQLEEAVSGAVVRPIWQVAASEGVVIEKIQLLLAVVTLAALLASAMGIASLMTSNIIERSKEIGLMKALGADQTEINLLFYSEATLSAILGGLLGCLAGWGLAGVIGDALFGQPLSFAWIVVPCVLFLSVLIALIGTWFPAHRIAKLYPIEVLYGR